MKTNVSTGNSLPDMNDETLIRMVLSGREDACTVLVHRYDRLLRSLLRRYLQDPEAIQEVVQDTFVRAFRALPGFRGDSKFSTWLSRIAISQAVSRLRSKRHAAWTPLEDAQIYRQADLDNNAAALEKVESDQLLRQIVRRLGPNDATALELFYFREQSIPEIGQITGWTPSNIKSRLSRARKRLEGALRKEGLRAEYFA